MSFARNFALGQQIAQTALDTYYDAREKARLRAIGEAKPEEIQNSYTTQDAEQLRAIANAKDAQGNPYYNLEANADGSYGLKANFAYAGQDGQMVQPGGIATTFAPRTAAVEFMGTRYAPEDLNEDRIAALRARAMADVISERDPVRGLQMRRSIKSDEREDERFSWERQQQPLKQRQLELGVRSAERDDRLGARKEEVQGIVDEVAKMPLEAIKAYASQLNTNQSQLPFLFTGTTKDGYQFVTIDPNTGSPTGKNFTLNEAQLRQMAAAAILGMKGLGQESLTLMAGVNKDIADIVERHNNLTISTAKLYNDALGKQNSDEFRRQQLAQTGAYYSGLLNRYRDSQARSEAAAKLENDINGVLEGYQAAMAAGPQGRDAAAIYAREYDQLRAVAAQRGLKVPPTLQALQAAQKNGQPMKPIKVEDAGQAYLVPQPNGGLRLMYTDGRGGYIGENGVLPSDRAAVLAQAGVPQALIPNIVWSDDGTTVLYRGREYALNELEQLARDAVRLGANDRRVEELQKLPHGTVPDTGSGPRITFAPDPRAPSIYARPEEWAAYREQQRREQQRRAQPGR